MLLREEGDTAWPAAGMHVSGKCNDRPLLPVRRSHVSGHAGVFVVCSALVNGHERVHAPLFFNVASTRPRLERRTRLIYSDLTQIPFCKELLNEAGASLQSDGK